MWKLIDDDSNELNGFLRRLKNAKFYADEDIEDELVRHLRNQGVNIISAKELGYKGRPDSFHAAYAFKKKRFLITKNGKHYLNDRQVPFQMVHGIIVLEGNMGNMDLYNRTVLSLMSLVPYGEIFSGMKIRIAQNEMTFRYINSNGQMVIDRTKSEGGKIYEWVEG
jgi:hypothetical protein